MHDSGRNLRSQNLFSDTTCDDPRLQNFWEETDKVSPVKWTKSRLQALHIKPVETKHGENIYNSTATRRSTQLNGSQRLEYTSNHKGTDTTLYEFNYNTTT